MTSFFLSLFFHGARNVLYKQDIGGSMIGDVEFKFALVGSREASVYDCEALEEAAVELMELGARGESGGAPGPDTALTNAILRLMTDTGMEGWSFGSIHLPWDGFNDLRKGDIGGACIVNNGSDICKFATIIAKVARGGFYGLGRGGSSLHSRNPYQILGADLLSPVNVVVTSAPFTNRGKVTGGTGTACAIANAMEIPVINLQKPHGFEQLESLIEGLKNPPAGWKGAIRITREEPTKVQLIGE